MNFARSSALYFSLVKVCIFFQDDSETSQSETAGKRKRLFHKECKSQFTESSRHKIIYILYLSIYLSKIYAGPMLLFCFPVRCMMYGFGDEQVPFTESVDLLEDLVVEYITEMVRRLCSPRASHNYVMYQRTSQVMLWVIGTFT